MGGAMVWKVLWDYHKKIENSMNRYTLGERNLLNHILEEVEAYGAVEDEVVLPVIEEVAPNVAESMAASHDKIKDLAADIQALEPGDPDEARIMKKLQKQFLLHCQREQQTIFPIIKTQLRDEQYTMARQAFTVRQELVAARGGTTPPGQYFIGLPTGGWTKGANRGW